MNAVEWNKKEELVADQAMKHLKQYSPLLAALTTNTRAELALILKVQEYCYDNMNFLKAFQKINVLFYKSKYTNLDQYDTLVCTRFLRIFFLLVGLHFPPHFDFGKSQKKNTESVMLRYYGGTKKAWNGEKCIKILNVEQKLKFYDLL